jgi:hypothetical protein
MEEFGIVFQEYGITRMTYVGGNIVYQFDTYDKNRGGRMNRPNGVRVGNLVYFHLWGYGFCVTDGYSVERIDPGNRHLASNSSDTESTIVSYAYDIGRVFPGAYTSRTNSILWKAEAGSSGGAHRYIYYSIDTGSFHHWDFSNSLFDETAFGPTISALATAPANTASAKPTIWTLGDVSGVTSMYDFVDYETYWTFNTGWIELAPGKFAVVHKVTPIAFDMSGTPTISVRGVDDYASLDVAFSGFTSFTAPTRGLAHTGREMNRFHQFQVSGSAITYGTFIGLRVEYEEAGTL